MHFQAQVVVSKIQYFEDYWTNDQMFLSKCYLQFLTMWASSTGLVPSNYASQEGYRKNLLADGSHNFMYLNHGSDVPSPLSYSIGYKQLTNPTHTQEEVITKGQNTRI